MQTTTSLPRDVIQVTASVAFEDEAEFDACVVRDGERAEARERHQTLQLLADEKLYLDLSPVSTAVEGAFESSYVDDQNDQMRGDWTTAFTEKLTVTPDERLYINLRPGRSTWGVEDL